MEIFVKRVRQI